MDTDDSRFSNNPPPPPPPGALGIGGAAMDFDQTVRVNVPSRGTEVFSRYKLERILGRGGMGVVWLAHDTKLERQVALKFLPNLIGLDPGAIKELKTETRRGLELSHPNIVRIYDFVDDDDAAAISMEYIDGRTLSELRHETQHGVYSVEEIAKWLPGVCDALDYAHQQRKLVHRDLKPANIMLTNGDHVAKIADFGIARSLSDTMSRLSVSNAGTSGTLPYMSPQQAMGDKPGPTDDVYSLGATLYELLAGKPPFYQGDIATQINNKMPPAMQSRRAELDIQCPDGIPKRWEEAIQACLAKEAYERPQSAGELAVMLGLKDAGSVTLSPKTARALAAAKAAQAKSRAPLWIGSGIAAVALIAGIFAIKRPEATRLPSEGVASAEASAEKPVEGEVEKADVGVAASKPEDGGVSLEKPAVAASTKTGDSGAKTDSMASTPDESIAASTVAGDASPAPDTGTPVPSVVAKTTPATETPTAVAAVPPPAISEPGVPPMVTSSEPDGLEGATPPAASATPPGADGAAMALTPGTGTPSPQGATIVIPAQQPGAQPQTIVLPPGTVLPPGAVIVQAAPGATEAAGAPTTAAADIPKQPVVGDPPEGHWKLEQLFPSPPFAMYSDNGKRHLLYEAQGKLKEKGLYSSTIDGKEGKNTHNAILLFQAKNSLIPNGLLDYPTLLAMGMETAPDEKEWNPPAQRYSGSGYRRPQPSKEEPNFFRRTGDKIKGLFD